jgi:hypothetical protein
MAEMAEATLVATAAETAAETGERTRSHQGTSMYSDLCTSTYPTFASLQIGSVCLVAGRVSSESTRVRTAFSLSPGATHNNCLHPIASDMSAGHTLPEGLRPPSFDRAVKVIVLALGDPPAMPVACLHVLNLCYQTVFKVLKVRGHTEALPQNRLLLVRTMGFLAAARTADQWRVLRTALAPEHCSCADGPAVLRTISHHSSLVDAPNTLGRLVHMMCCLFTHFFDPRRPSPSYSAWRGPRWPTLCEIFPEGAVRSVHALCTWLYLDTLDGAGQGELGMLVCRLFLAMPAYAVQGVLKTPALLVWMHRALVEGIDTIHANHPQRPESGRQRHLVPFLASILWRHLTDHEMQMWARGSTHLGLTAKDVCIALCRYIDVARHDPHREGDPHDPLAGFGDNLALLTGRLLAALPEVESVRLLPCAHEAIVRELSMFRPPSEILRRYAFGKNWDDCCNGPSCIVTYARRDLGFRVCGGCRTAQYCSRICQKRVWKYPGAGHREVCWMYKAFHAAQRTVRLRVGRETAIRELADKMSPAQLTTVCNNLRSLQASRHAQLRT